jgi:dCTP deaminase
MSIKADRWIKRMCQPTREALLVNGEFYAWFGSHRADALLALRNCGSRLLSTKFIEHVPMISPFSDKQISQVEIPGEVERRSAMHYKGEFYCWQEELKEKAAADGYLFPLMGPDWSMFDLEVGPRMRSIIPYGLSSYGYDIRCGNEFKIFTNLNTTVVDPKNFTEDNFVTRHADDGDAIIIPPNSFALANTPEQFNIDRDTLVICLGKSTYARCGIIVNVTPLEPEWTGSLTLEFSNTTPLPAKIYAGEGCAQILFIGSDEECEVSYADRKGKYMHQAAVPVSPKML